MTTTRRRVSRDSILFVAGLAGIAHEILVLDGERPSVLILLATMAGLPAFLGFDERRRKDREP